MSLPFPRNSPSRFRDLLGRQGVSSLRTGERTPRLPVYGIKVPEVVMESGELTKMTFEVMNVTSPPVAVRRMVKESMSESCFLTG